jgi:hypothetical protein
MIVVEAGAVSARGGKPMGVFKDLAIQELNETSEPPICGKCGKHNNGAFIICPTCVGSAPKDPTTGTTDWNAVSNQIKNKEESQ